MSIHCNLFWNPQINRVRGRTRCYSHILPANQESQLAVFGKFFFIALPEDRYPSYLHFKKRHSLPGTNQYVHMEANHTRTCSQRTWTEAPFMATDLNSQKQSRREEGRWKRTVHQRQWHAHWSCRSKHARQHCSSFSTERRNITWKVCVPGKGITHSSETRWTCLQGCDFRE